MNDNTPDKPADAAGKLNNDDRTFLYQLAVALTYFAIKMAPIWFGIPIERYVSGFVLAILAFLGIVLVSINSAKRNSNLLSGMVMWIVMLVGTAMFVAKY